MVVDFSGSADSQLRAYWSKVLRVLRSEYETNCLRPDENCTTKEFHHWLKDTWGVSLLDSVAHYGIDGVDIEDSSLTLLLLRVPA